MPECALCERDVNKTTKHHLVPKQQKGRVTVELCSPCHSQIHALFTNKTLARELHDLETLKADPDMRRYLGFIRKQKDRKVSVRRSKKRR
ncbi:MAG: hypothetical protein ACYTFT_09865 [Planctomycetota bacterium]|jgi:hypothetical protein